MSLALDSKHREGSEKQIIKQTSRTQRFSSYGEGSIKSGKQFEKAFLGEADRSLTLNEDQYTEYLAAFLKTHQDPNIRCC